jgi:hypothetical protein
MSPAFKRIGNWEKRFRYALNGKSAPTVIKKRNVPMTLEERIEKLESELNRTKNRKRKAWAVVAAIIILSGIAVYARGNGAGQSDIPYEIRAQQIVLVDEKGNPRCILNMGKDGPGLTLSDNNGEMRSILSVDANESRLSLYDKKGDPRAVLSVDDNGVGLALYDESGNPRAGLFQGKNGPQLTLFDRKGKEHWSTPSMK